MINKLEQINNKYIHITEQLSDPDVIKNSEKLQELMKECSCLEPIVVKYKQYTDVLSQLDEEKQMLQKNEDEEFTELLKDDIKQLSEKKETLINDLKLLLIPKDLTDEKNIIIEIRAGVGGDEAGLFAGELFRMYLRYAEKQNWKTELLIVNEPKTDCYKEVIFSIKGKNVYSKLKYESGVHRVQRVPKTESKGRIHTSSVTIAVLPEADEIEVEINDKDINFDVFRSSGNGGQCVNTTDSAVRLTHFPTGIVISCQDEKSQIENRAKAMKILRAKLYDLYLKEQNKEISKERKTQVGSGDRSEKVRTYNFPQSRVTDHRVNFTSYTLDTFLNGDIIELIEVLAINEQTKKFL